MQPLKICMMGFPEEEQASFQSLLEEACPLPDVRFHDPSELRQNTRIADCDLIVLRHKAEAEWVGEFLAARMLHHAYQPVVAVTDEFSAALVLQLNNLGVDRVIPRAVVRGLLPECLESFFPEIFRNAPNRLGEAQGEYAFEGLSGIPRFLRTEKTSLVFVERLLDTLDALVIVLTPDGKIVFLNRRCEAATGYQLAEVAGRLLSEIFLLPEETEEVMQVINDLSNRKYPNQHQNSWLTREGKELRIEWSNTVLLDDGGNVGYIIAMGLDITGFYRQAEELRALEQRFAKVFNTSMIGIAILSRPEGRIVQANEGLAKITGIAQEALAGMNLTETKLFASEKMLKTAFERVSRQSSPFFAETPVFTQDRRVRHVKLSLDFFDLEGQAGFLLLVQDITEQAQAEERYVQLNAELEVRILEAVSEQEAINRELMNEISFRQAIESSSQRLNEIIWETPDIVTMVDVGGRMRYLNKAGRKALGLGEIDSVSEFSVYQFYTPEVREYVQQVVKPHVLEFGFWQGETTLVFEGGRSIPISQVILAHRDTEGNLQYFSSTARDISTQKEYEARLELSYDCEKRLGEMRSHLFSMTSHQFRTPLTTVFSSAELLEHYGESWDAEKRGTHLKRIQAAVRRMETLLGGILQLSQMESLNELERTDIELVAFCKRVLDDFKLNIKESHLIEYVPAQPEIVVWTDEELLRRVLDNLLSNAIKYSAAGSTVQVAVCVENQQANLCVSDQGLGIPLEEQPKLFDPFFRGGNVADIPGNGLGLMIVKKSLELMQGSIDVSSKVGVGTSVAVRFPVQEGRLDG